MKKCKYRKLVYKGYLDNNDALIHFCKLDAQSYEERAVEVFPNGDYGYADKKFEFNGTFLSDCPFPTISEYYTWGEFATNEADYYDITEEEFETEWRRAIEYCQEHSIIPNRLP